MSPISRIPSPSTSSRRAVLAGSAALAAALCAPRAFAMSVGDAETMIRKVVADVLKIINSGKSEAAILVDFQRIFRNYADVPRIAAAILGPPWRTASDAEKSAYVDALTGYLARKYGRRFDTAKGAKIEITGSKDYGSKGIIVATMVSTDTWDPYPVEWHVIETSAGLKFFDMYVEGVKLLSSEKAEIGALYDRNGRSVARLAEALKTRG